MFTIPEIDYTALYLCDEKISFPFAKLSITINYTKITVVYYWTCHFIIQCLLGDYILAFTYFGHLYKRG